VKSALSSKTTDLPSIAKAGQEFALTQLSPEGLSCYWYGALLQYGELYFTVQTEAQKKKAIEEEQQVEIENEKGSVSGRSKEAVV
jgi:Glycosyl transferase family 90